MTTNTTGIDILPDNIIINTETPVPATTINLGRIADEDLITKRELCRAFACSERTLQRMVERFEIPPPMTLAGRKVWIAGKVKAWLAEVASGKEAEALKEARRLRLFTY